MIDPHELDRRLDRQIHLATLMANFQVMSVASESDSKRLLFCVGFGLPNGALGSEWTVISLPWDPLVREIPRMELLASKLETKLRTIQSTGPYYLAGHCFGGLIALEIAQNLISKGERVETLALIETAFPGKTRRRLRPLRRALISAMYPRDFLKYVSENFRDFIRSLQCLDINSVKRKSAMIEIMNHYEPRRYPGALTLIVGRRSPGRFFPRSGWISMTEGRLEVLLAEGDHFHDLLKGNDFVRVMRECFAILQSDTDRPRSQALSG